MANRMIRPGRTASLLGGALTLTALLAAPADAQRTFRADSIRQIQSVEPMSGPPGTHVEIYTENLALEARVHVGIGAIDDGFEALTEGFQAEWGEVSASFQLPQRLRWDRPVYVIVFNASFSPIALSPPFHVTNPQGMIRRAGTITEEADGCPTLRDADELLYALTGDLGTAGPGDEVVVEGRYAESSACMTGSTIGVVRVTRGG